MLNPFLLLNVLSITGSLLVVGGEVVQPVSRFGPPEPVLGGVVDPWCAGESPSRVPDLKISTQESDSGHGSRPPYKYNFALVPSSLENVSMLKRSSQKGSQL